MRCVKIFFAVFSSFLFIIGLYLFAASLWIQSYFGNVELEQILLNLSQPLNGVALKLIGLGVFIILIVGSIVGFLLLYVIHNLFKNKKDFVLLLLSALFLAYPCYTWQLIDFIKANLTVGTIYEEHHKNPDLKTNGRNLIFIVLESYEKSFQNAAILSKNLSPRLTQIQNDNTSFDGFYQLKSTKWTITSLLSSFCGVPLKLGGTLINLSSFQDFIPQMPCWPEQFKSQGYETVLMKAAAIQFTGTNHFARNHGFKKAIGFKELKNKYSDNNESEWGLNDTAFYRAVKDELIALSQSGKPFLLSTVQADTHQPNGHTHKDCPVSFNDYRDAVLCSDKAVADLIEWIQKQPFYQNTTIVVMGDHIVPNTNADSFIQKLPSHEIYLTVINPSSDLKPVKHQFTNLDVAPTILDALGVHFDGTFGLGRSLYRAEKTLIEQMGAADLEFALACQSAKYTSFGNVLSKDVFEEPHRLKPVLLNEQIDFSTNLYEKIAAKNLSEIVLNQYWMDDSQAEIKFRVQKPTTDFSLRFHLFVPLFNVSQKTVRVYVNNKLKTEWLFNKTQIPETVLPLSPADFDGDIVWIRLEVQTPSTNKKLYRGIQFIGMVLEK